MASPSPTKELPPSLPRDVDGFRLLRELGRGGMGVVYLAEELSSGRTVALKVLAAGSEVSEEAFERFRRESRMAASISDSRCVFVYGAHQIEGSPAIAMELCPGETLEHRMGKGKPIPIETAVRWTIEILEGLEAAHRAGVVHRDVKPSNCFITQDDHVKVGDFGLSRSLDADIRLTQSGAFLGSPLYASPEQVRGRDVDVRCDIYSCGATLYALLAGRAPYQGQNIGEVLARILSESPPSLRSLRPDVPADLEKVVARAMDRDPERRFRDHASFRDALDPFVAEEIVAVGPVLRFFACALDQMLFGMLIGGLVVLGASQGWPLFEMVPGQPGKLGSLAGTLLVSCLPALYFALSEGLAGATLSRWMFGQKVVDARTRRPNLRRAIVRACIYFGPGLLAAAWIHDLALSQNASGALSLAVSLAIYGGLASSMRRRNGYRGLHELASGTRVVRARSPFARTERSRPVPVHPVTGAASPTESWPADLGPYRIESSLGSTPTGTLLQGLDQNLGRPVWIYARGNHAAAASDQRRSLARPGRLRWLDAVHRGDALFEVFEAPGGTNLSACAAAGPPLDWRTSHRLLSALAGELALPPLGPTPLCIEQVWIDRAWNLRLLDEPMGSGPFASRSPLELLSDAARLVLLERELPGGQLPPGLPTSAEPVVRKLLGKDGAFASLEEADRDLRSLSRGPMRLTSTARAVQIAVSASPVLFFLIMSLGAMFALAAPIDRFMANMRCIRQLRAQDASPPAVERMDAEDRRARELVISSAARDAWNGAFVRGTEPEDREIQRRAVEAWPSPSADDLAWARERIRARPFRTREPDPATSDAPGVTADVGNPGFGPRGTVSVSAGDEDTLEQVRWLIIPRFAVIAVCAWGLLSTLFALIFRGGLSLKLFGMGVRDARGEMASRLRCAWRSLLVWVPLALLYWAAASLAKSHSALSLTILFVTASVQALAVGYAISRPTRAIQDRLAGTHLVSR